MKPLAQLRFLLGFILLLTLAAPAQRRHDPLDKDEINQLRDAMLEPDDRLKLYVTFARDRMTKLEQMRADPKTTDRALKTHDLLEDFLSIYDELNDNVDMYVGRKDDIRKPLKLVIEADTEFQSKLRALKDAAHTDAAESKQYEFLLSNAIETVDASADDHRATVPEVEEYVKRKKKTAKETK
jgi:hypothetical protein